jgi:hypothetical protein
MQRNPKRFPLTYRKAAAAPLGTRCMGDSAEQLKIRLASHGIDERSSARVETPRRPINTNQLGNAAI